ncbi:MAG TPA: hypothetical protein VHA07_05700 [Devosia sp.]|nr:hypothetical protein [Devosia sp.]
MRKSLLAASSALVLTAALGALPAMAQTASGGAGSIATVTCGDIASLPVAYQAALIYYAAGYGDGLAAAANGGLATGAASAPADAGAAANDASSASGSEASSSAGGGASGGAMIGGLGLQAQAIITACQADASALLTDVIAKNGGSAGTGTESTTASSSEALSAPSSQASSSSEAAPSSSEAASSSQAAPAPSETSSSESAPASGASDLSSSSSSAM